MNSWLHSCGRGMLALSFLAGWTAAGAASSQQEPDSTNNRELVAKYPKSALEQPRQLRQPYEDIEIYRRLLLKTLQPYVSEAINFKTPSGKKSESMSNTPATAYFSGLYDATSANYHQGVTNPYQAGANAHASYGIGHLNIEGVFLPSSGIVISATLPIFYAPQEKKTQAEPKTLTEWERARRELRGEKIDKSEEKQAKSPPYILEAVLHSLAINGHHLSGLLPNEKVSIVLTFRGLGAQQCTVCHSARNFSYWSTQSGQNSELAAVWAGMQSTNVPQTTPWLPQNNLSPPAYESLNPQTSTGGQQGESAATNQTKLQPREASNNRMLLGDLHLKQGRYEEALAAYSRASEECQSSIRSLTTTPKWYLEPQGREALMALLELQNKIIQCHMAMKQEGQVQEGLKTLKRFMSMLEHADVKPSTAKSPDKSAAKESVLSTRIVISAPKPLLDQVGKGQITFEEFKKQAKVDVLKFEETGW
jgi:tetratricopeptide (TPR) repeat protein